MSGSPDRHQPPLIPREALFGSPNRVSPQLSPDGGRIAYLAPVRNVLNLWVMEVGGAEGSPVSRQEGAGVRGYFWAQDGRSLFFFRDSEGREDWRLFRVELGTGATRQVGLTREESDTLQEPHAVQVAVIGQSRRPPQRLLLAINKRNPNLFDVYELRLEDESVHLVLQNPGNYAAFLTDSKPSVRGVMAARPDGGLDLLLSQGGALPLARRLRWDAEDALTSGPIGFSRDGRHLLMLDSRHVPTTRLVALELRSGKLHVLAEDPEADVCGVLTHPDTREVQAVAFLRERMLWRALDAQVAPHLERLRARDIGDFSLVNRDERDRRWLLRYTSDGDPVSYHLYDLEQGALRPLFHAHADLEGRRLAQMEPFRFEARDGLAIHGYLSFPPGMPRQRLPAVLVVHGGPWSRHTWGFSAPAQWLANRGYLCVEVNFRGSTGYGKGFLNAGDREWGGRMQHDLEDGMRFVIERGYADPARLGILGASYGGYAVLMAAVSTPDLFKCGIDAFGPTNLVTFLKNAPPAWAAARAIFNRRIGDPERDAPALLERSPLPRADRIRMPMLIAQGANDVRVRREESDLLVEALARNGVEHEYIVFPDEGHGFVKPENRLRFYAAAERFLARHLGGRNEPGAMEAAP